MSEEINHGVLRGRKDTDFIAGTIPFQERNPSGNWRNYLPPAEWQWKNGKDTMACVTFSLLNSIETQEFFLTGQRVNYSDRWIALMSGTTPQGNYLYAVADTVRKFGLVREESWPAPSSFDWNTYYAQPDAATMKKLLAEGEEWKKTHSLAYEWLTTSLEDIQTHLKHCPLQVVIPGHAIEGFKQVGDIHGYFDSYEPFEKSTWRGNLTDVFKAVLTINDNESMRLILDNGTVYLVGSTGKLGIADKATLDKFKQIDPNIFTGSTAGIPQVGTATHDDAFIIHG